MSILGAGDGPCPCGTGRPYAVCCGPLLRAEPLAATAEELMRSRFTAYAVGDVPHLLRTWHPRTRPDHPGLDADVAWTRLRVLRVKDGGPDDEQCVPDPVVHKRGQDGPEGGRGRRSWGASGRQRGGASHAARVGPYPGASSGARPRAPVQPSVRSSTHLSAESSARLG